MNREIRNRLLAPLVVLGALFASGAAAEQAPVRVIVGAAAGGALDPYARIVTEYMGKTLGRTIIIENKVGANGNLAAQLVLDAPADGNTIWLGTQSMTEINPIVFRNLHWSMSDFVPIIKGVAAPLVLVTHPSMPVKTLSELIAHVKGNPGKLGYASFSPGTPSHFLGSQMSQRFGLDLTHVPYRGSGPQTTDLIAGHALIGFAQLANIIPHVASGKLNAIAVTGANRSRFLPNVPTFSDLGYPEFTTTVWFGLFLRAGTPEPIVSAYVAAATAAHKDATVVSKLETLGFDVVAETGPQVSESIKQQSERWRRLIEATGFKVTE